MTFPSHHVRSSTFQRTISSPRTGPVVDDVWVGSDIRGWTGTNRPPPCILVHGATFRTWYMTTGAYPGLQNYYQLTAMLARHYTLYVADLGGDLWGSTDHVERIEEARTHLNATWGTSGKVTLVGFSMGGLGCMNYARAYPANVQAIATIFPVTNLLQFRNAAETPEGIDMWYGDVTLPGYIESRDGSMHNPSTYAALMDPDIPVKIHYTSTDDIIPVSTIVDFQTARPQTEIEMVGDLGHNDATIGQSIASVEEFLLRTAG